MPTQRIIHFTRKQERSAARAHSEHIYCLRVQC